MTHNIKLVSVGILFLMNSICIIYMTCNDFPQQIIQKNIITYSVLVCTYFYYIFNRHYYDTYSSFFPYKLTLFVDIICSISLMTHFLITYGNIYDTRNKFNSLFWSSFIVIELLFIIIYIYPFPIEVCSSSFVQNTEINTIQDNSEQNNTQSYQNKYFTLAINKKKEQNEECSICMEKFNKPGDFPIKLTKCKHKFHWTCMNTWAVHKLNKRESTTCPLCRDIIMVIKPI